MLDWTLPALTRDDLIEYAVIAAFILLPIIGILRLMLWPRTLCPAVESGASDAMLYERDRRRREDATDADAESGDGGGDGGSGGD